MTITVDLTVRGILDPGSDDGGTNDIGCVARSSVSSPGLAMPVAVRNRRVSRENIMDAALPSILSTEVNALWVVLTDAQTS